MGGVTFFSDPNSRATASFRVHSEKGVVCTESVTKTLQSVPPAFRMNSIIDADFSWIQDRLIRKLQERIYEME